MTLLSLVLVLVLALTWPGLAAELSAARTLDSRLAPAAPSISLAAPAARIPAMTIMALPAEKGSPAASEAPKTPDFSKMSGVQAKTAGESDFLAKLGSLLGAKESKIPAEPAKAEFRKTELLKLRMTQMSVGMREVAVKRDKLAGMKEDEAQEFLKKHEIPAVVGPDGHLYIIDHHHLVRAAWEAGITDVHVKIRADFSSLSREQFWLKMAEAKWVYPYDQFGGGPHHPRHLPEDVRGLANDPFRDVAWQARERGGDDKNATPFSEFRWANFFREHLKTYPVFKDFEQAVAEALKLAKSELAKDLPGYKGGK